MSLTVNESICDEVGRLSIELVGLKRRVELLEAVNKSRGRGRQKNNVLRRKVAGNGQRERGNKRKRIIKEVSTLGNVTDDDDGKNTTKKETDADTDHGPKRSLRLRSILQNRQGRSFLSSEQAETSADEDDWMVISDNEEVDNDHFVPFESVQEEHDYESEDAKVSPAAPSSRLRNSRKRKSKRTSDVNLRKKVSPNPEPLQCKECGKMFKHLSVLHDHHISHRKNPGLFVCDSCGQGFKHERNLKRHLKTHSGKKTHPCETCDMEFFRNSDLIRHEKTHSGVKLFLCEICPKSFTRPLSLTQHMRLHVGERPYACSQCPKAYTTKSALDYHDAKSHSNVRARPDEDLSAEILEEPELENDRRMMIDIKINRVPE